MGKRYQAFTLLNESAEHGMTPRTAQRLKSETDFKSLHSDPRFAALMGGAKNIAESPSK